MKVNVLSDKIGWFGKYSGYECLPDYYPKNIEATVNTATYNLYNKVAGKIYKVRNRINSRSEDIFNEVKFSRKVSANDASHILYLESHIHLLKKLKPANRIFGTIHLPVSRWSNLRLQMLESLENVILLYNEEFEIFKQYVPSQKIHVIKHGVDINFFKPGKTEKVVKNKVLFVGHFLRNFEMTYKVYNTICKDVSTEIQFHFIIPSSFRNTSILQKLAQNPNVFFHEKLSDEELLEQYQTSYVMVMPMSDSGANTALVQALSVGLPVITTDVGGIRSYGGGTVYPIITNNDYVAMTELFLKYFYDEEYRNSISQQVRKYSVENLDWFLTANHHATLYQHATKEAVQKIAQV